MKILWTRDSVCMADDCNAPNARTEEVDGPLTISDLLDKAAYYVPSVGGAVWAVWVENTIAGYLEMSTTGYLLRDEAILDGTMVLKPRRTFWKRNSDTLHVDCVLHTMDFFFSRKGPDGPIIEKFPECATLLEKVKASRKQS